MYKSRLLAVFFACVLPFITSASQASSCPNPGAYPFNDCSLPGVRQGSYPYFDQGVKNVIYQAKKNGDFNLRAQYDKKSDRSQFLLNLSNIFDIDKTKYMLKVKVRNGVASGSVQINGVIEDLGITKRETLMTANLEGDWTLSADGQFIGFNTTDIFCNDAFATYCTQSESIYLVLADAINTGKKNIKTTGVAVTTVPLPAAVWLFGSGLLGLIGIARKKKAA